MDQFLSRLDATIARHRLLADGESALVAVSGGVDSMVLLRVLVELSTKHRWKLFVAHLNHQLRGREADADERFVGRAARRLGLPFYSERVDVARFARKRKVSVEMAARAARHDLLARVARHLGLRTIVLAHHADDQVELFFLRLLRGAGPQGLSGMEWLAPSPANSEIKLARPFLEEPKAALEEFARRKRIRFRIDATNRSTDILRNRIRGKLLPHLRRDYQPEIDKLVLRAMELMRAESDFTSTEALAWLKRPRRKHWGTLPAALQRCILHAELLRAGVMPDFDRVERLRAEPPAWITVRSGTDCRRRDNGRLEIRSTNQPRFPEDDALITLGRAGAACFGPVQFRWRLVDGAPSLRRRAQTEYFDARAVGNRVLVRHWRAGDRFQPIGMKSEVKLQDFFVNQKIPRARRHELLLAVTSDNKIFWVEGARISERCKVTPTTKQILRWSWRRS